MGVSRVGWRWVYGSAGAYRRPSPVIREREGSWFVPRDDRAVDGVHDLGGMHGFGRVPVEIDEPLFHDPWEGRVWRMLATVMGSTTTDRFRYTIEQMPPAEYLASSY